MNKGQETPKISLINFSRHEWFDFALLVFERMLSLIAFSSTARTSSTAVSYYSLTNLKTVSVIIEAASVIKLESGFYYLYGASAADKAKAQKAAAKICQAAECK
jgi:hypothetical protein